MVKMEKKPTLSPGLIVICGATATGKSGVGLELAQKLDGAIISADSRQVYREFDIGTAKLTVAERQLVPHYLIDVCDPTVTMTLADYQERSLSAIALCHQQGKIPLLVGGTGLYIKSIVKGLKIPRVAPQPELRSQLIALGQVQCYAFLQQVDPVAAQKIHPNDSFRTLRALEVFYVTGCPISEQQGENIPHYPILQIGLDYSDTEVLRDRIAQRTAQMFVAGWVAEVQSLREKYGANLPLLNTLGYQEIKQYLAGEISLAEAQELIILHTRQFAKQQRTWFRAYPEIEWYDISQPNLREQIWLRVQKFRADFNLM
jgi:tRNA dimethylallyltransferase